MRQWYGNHAEHSRVNAEQEVISPEALAELLCEQLELGATGTLFLTTDANHWGCFGLDDGDIVTVRCRGAKGARALQHIAQASGFSARFEASDIADTVTHVRDFDHAAVFAALKAPLTVQTDAAIAAEEAAGSSAPGGPTTMPAENAARIGGVIKAEAEKVLGPIGPVVCDELFAARPGFQATDIQYILGRLAQQVGNPDAGREFQLRVLAKLRGE